MAIDFAKKEIALSYSETFKTLKPGWGETCADGPSMDNADYGTRLEKSGDKLFFKGNFLRVGVFVTCNWNEFIDPEVIMVKINSDSEGNNGTTIFNNNVRWLIDAAASRDQGAKTDDRVLIHINIPTMAIHDKIIKSIYIKCNYGWPTRKPMSGYWNLQSSGNNSIKIHRAYTWSGKSLINIESTEGFSNNEGYHYTNSNTTISAYPEHYNGNVTINFDSYQTDGNTNKSYFTSNYGFMKATIKLTNYFSTLVDTNESQTKTKQYRTPYSLVLKGQDKDGNSIFEEIYIGPSTITNESTKEVELKSSDHFSNFSKITDAKVTYYNGGAELDRSNDQTITNENTLVNYGITLQQDGNLVNVLNQYVTHGKDASNKQYIELQAIFNGKLTRIPNCPYAFYNKAPISIKGAKQTFSGAISVKNNEILASATYNYLVSADTSVLNTRPIEPGESYQLTCNVINLLNFNNGTLQQKITKYQDININSLKLSNQEQPKYVAFGNPDPKIKYRDPNDKTNTYYDVDGNIIIRGEELKFINDFKVYNLNDGTKLENISAYVNVDGSDIGYQISNSNYCSYQKLRKNNSTDTDTRKITLSYSFEENGTLLSNTYSFPNEIILGRIVSLEPGKHYSIIKTQEGEIKYYLSDNGGDKDFPFGNTKLTSNQLIDLRKTGSAYFSLSRQVPENSGLLAKEGLTISINDGAFEKTIFFTNDELSLSLLLELIELLYEGRTNVFSFFESEMFSDEEEEFVEGLLKDKIKFSIELAYYYKIADNRQDDVKTVVFSITENELSFLKSVEPIGLRKKGVIINPIRKENENEDLGNDNTFIINVNDLKASGRDENDKVIKWEKQNGIKIVFHTDETQKDSEGKPKPIILPTFEIYLGEDGFVHLSNCKIDEPPATAET